MHQNSLGCPLLWRPGASAYNICLKCLECRCDSCADRQRLGGDFNKKRMSRSLEDTLDRIFEEDPYPSSDKIREVLELHKGAGYQRIVEWFAQKRREDERRPKNYVKPDLAASSKAKLNFGRRRPQQQKGKDPFNWELPQ